MEPRVMQICYTSGPRNWYHAGKQSLFLVARRTVLVPFLNRGVMLDPD